jgi:carboxyl-terminal processing protease
MNKLQRSPRGFPLFHLMHFPFQAHAGATLGFSGLSVLMLFATPDAPKEKHVPFEIEKLESAIEIIKENHVNPHSTDELVTAAIHGMVDHLDPFSYYSTPSAYRNDSLRQKSGQYWSTGITVQAVDGRLLVWSVDSGSAAFVAGVLPGDQFKDIEEHQASDITATEADDLLNPFVASQDATGARIPILFHVYRHSSSTELGYMLLPGYVNRDAGVTSFMLDTCTGYIRFDGFEEHTSADVMTAIYSLKNQSATRYILDLRHNPGGLVRQAVNLADALIGRMDPLLTMRHQEGSSRPVFGQQRDITDGAAMVVLVGHHTASAAELLAGMLQDEDRAYIVGSPTFGKGMASLRYPFVDGSGLTLIISMCQLPSGRFIQREYAGSNYAQKAKPFRSDVENYDHANDTLFVPGKGGYLTRSGRQIFGGEGIIPDYITDALPTKSLGNSNDCDWILYRTTENYFEQHGEAILKQRTNPTAVQSLKIDDHLPAMLRDAAQQEGVYLEWENVKADMPAIKQNVLSRMGSRLFGKLVWEKYDIESDRLIQMALHVFPKAEQLAAASDRARVPGE